MNLPSKVTPYKKSILYTFPKILSILKKNNVTVGNLYKEVKKYFDTVVDYLDALDCLFALHKIDYIEGGILTYVKED